MNNSLNQTSFYKIHTNYLPPIFDNNNNLSYLPPTINSPTFAILLIFLLSPMILIGNSLILIATYRFKRLRTPSNYLLISLAISDLGIGTIVPIIIYLHYDTRLNLIILLKNVRLCLINYCMMIGLCSVSVLVMVAIAMDRFTSLARPLRYNNLITHQAIERYILIFWIYAFLVGFTPFGVKLWENDGSTDGQLVHLDRLDVCVFKKAIGHPLQLFMFCAIYGPSMFVLVYCYGYVYMIARGHARATSSVSTLAGTMVCANVTSTPSPRYGLALALTSGAFLLLWLPFQVCMLMDVLFSTDILNDDTTTIYLSIPIFTNSGLNPIIYGYRNAEIRTAVRRVVDDLLTTFGFGGVAASGRNLQPASYAIAAAAAGATGAGLAGTDQRHLASLNNSSFIHQRHHLYLHSPGLPTDKSVEQLGDFLLVPLQTRPDISVSDGAIERHLKMIVTSDEINGKRSTCLKTSISLIEDFKWYEKYNQRKYGFSIV